MSESRRKMFEAFEHIVEGAYDYKEALRRQGIKHSNVNLLREKIKRSKLVPRYIHDKQVRDFDNHRSLHFSLF